MAKKSSVFVKKKGSKGKAKAKPKKAESSKSGSKKKDKFNTRITKKLCGIVEAFNKKYSNESEFGLESKISMAIIYSDETKDEHIICHNDKNILKNIVGEKIVEIKNDKNINVIEMRNSLKDLELVIPVLGGGTTTSTNPTETETETDTDTDSKTKGKYYEDKKFEKIFKTHEFESKYPVSNIYFE